MKTFKEFVSKVRESSRVTKAAAIIAAISVPVGLVADGLSLLGDASSVVSSNNKDTFDNPASSSEDPTRAADALHAGGSSSKTSNLAENVAFNYMRVFGAMRSNMLHWSIDAGGYEVAQDGKLKLKTGVEIEGELPEFYQTWEYNRIKPLSNRLWSIALGKQFDHWMQSAFRTSDRDEAVRCYEKLYGYSDLDDREFDFDCAEDEKENLGWLHLIIEGVNGETASPMSMTYLPMVRGSSDFRWSTYGTDFVERLCSKVNPKSSKQRIEGLTVETRQIPTVGRGDQYLWPVAVYRRSPKNSFSGTLVEDAQVPICLWSGDDEMVPIRAPGRQNAITVPIPDGWYWQ